MDNRDWLAKLTPAERRDWNGIVRHTRNKLLPMMEKSAFMLNIAPDGKPDAKYCIELGMSVMLDKPVLVIAPAGCPVPARLRRVADEVVELPAGADMDTEAGQQLIIAAIKRIQASLPDDPDPRAIAASEV